MLHLSRLPTWSLASRHHYLPTVSRLLSTEDGGYMNIDAEEEVIQTEKELKPFFQFTIRPGQEKEYQTQRVAQLKHWFTVLRNRQLAEKTLPIYEETMRKRAEALSKRKQQQKIQSIIDNPGQHPANKQLESAAQHRYSNPTDWDQIQADAAGNPALEGQLAAFLAHPKHIMRYETRVRKESTLLNPIIFEFAKHSAVVSAVESAHQMLFDGGFNEDELELSSLPSLPATALFGAVEHEEQWQTPTENDGVVNLLHTFEKQDTAVLDRKNALMNLTNTSRQDIRIEDNVKMNKSALFELGIDGGFDDANNDEPEDDDSDEREKVDDDDDVAAMYNFSDEEDETALLGPLWEAAKERVMEKPLKLTGDQKVRLGSIAEKIEHLAEPNSLDLLSTESCLAQITDPEVKSRVQRAILSACIEDFHTFSEAFDAKSLPALAQCALDDAYDRLKAAEELKNPYIKPVDRLLALLRRDLGEFSDFPLAEECLREASAGNPDYPMSSELIAQVRSHTNTISCMQEEKTTSIPLNLSEMLSTELPLLESTQNLSTLQHSLDDMLEKDYAVVMRSRFDLSDDDDDDDELPPLLDQFPNGTNHELDEFDDGDVLEVNSLNDVIDDLLGKAIPRGKTELNRLVFEQMKKHKQHSPRVGEALVYKPTRTRLHELLGSLSMLYSISSSDALTSVDVETLSSLLTSSGIVAPTPLTDDSPLAKRAVRSLAFLRALGAQLPTAEDKKILRVIELLHTHLYRVAVRNTEISSGPSPAHPEGQGGEGAAGEQDEAGAVADAAVETFWAAQAAPHEEAYETYLETVEQWMHEQAAIGLHLIPREEVATRQHANARLQDFGVAYTTAEYVEPYGSKAQTKRTRFAARAVKIEIHVPSLNLSECVLARFKELAGSCFDEKQNKLTIVAKKFRNQSDNRRYAEQLIRALMTEAHKADPNFFAFEDLAIPVDQLSKQLLQEPRKPLPAGLPAEFWEFKYWTMSKEQIEKIDDPELRHRVKQLRHYRYTYQIVPLFPKIKQ